MLKRIFDIVFSILTVILLLPLIIIISFFVFVFIGRPIFFTQRRAGLNGKVFEIIKFRTMNNKTDLSGELLPDNQRLTRFGKFLRSTSLDELPEIFNIIKGEMSFVGPRPLLEEYLTLYNKEQARRHEVRPGITGLAQVSGRNTLNWEEKFKYDLEYINKNNLFLDLKIIFLTVINVLRRDGINQDKENTAEKFKGSVNF